MQSVCYLSTWKRFVNEGVLDPSRISKRIIESWHRCKSQQVNPYLKKGEHFLTSDLFKQQKEKNSLLLQAVLPTLKRIDKMMIELEAIVLLIDPSGYVLSITGNKKVLHEARRINFVEGVRWTEEEVGTNAIGTALQTSEAIMVSGSEHYSIASHNWSCAAAPIHSCEGELLGVIDVSCPVDRAHPFMLGMVASLAQEAEKELNVQAHKKEIELINRCTHLLESSQSVVVCNEREKVVAVSEDLRQHIPNYKGMDRKELLKYGVKVEMESSILASDQTTCIGTCLHIKKVDELSSSWTLTSKPFYFEGTIGTSSSFQRTLDDVKRVAPTEASVYISGETGTGKEIIARAIHFNSKRKNGPFIALNCGALPAELIESELFGYVEGAFTGAKRQGHKGKFEQANNGTIFLDEIGEISPAMQVKLLRVLQERRITPVGGTKEIELDVRIITATHWNLSQLVEEGKFRKDLYYRLHVYPIYVPPLRERKEDIPYLVHYYCKQNDWNIQMPEEYIERLKQYDWPGNIRELFNVLERLRISFPYLGAENYHVLDKFFVTDVHCFPIQKETHKLNARENIQKDLMIEALQKTQGNVSQAAKLLNMPRSTFYRRMQKYHL
ncbi:sigma-54-dependent Fis family transcriptional regulator [Pseudobacillus sp. FSL P4-0506]|uniref:sigma-54-dependent Fis family transcriptional regulator n=1 Tax=Pseudobacillus sp. FSL P4-0506 TaxID=2921576 RepID=UPI0030F960F7